MISLIMIMFIAIFSDHEVSPEVNFVRLLGLENRSDYTLTDENQEILNDLNETLGDWYKKHTRTEEIK